MDFKTLAEKHLGEKPLRALLCIDPGETTGWCIFYGVTLLRSGQVNTATIEKGIDELTTLLKTAKFDDVRGNQTLEVVIEDYAIYAWRAKQHAGSKVLTARIIGVTETLCRQQGLKLTKQMASLAKGFATDDKLKEWGFWIKGQKHARDAIRHAIYYILFNKGGK